MTATGERKGKAALAPAAVLGRLDGGRGVPYASSVVDLGVYGYTETEYTASGIASRYAPAVGNSLAADGIWLAEPCEPDGYTTRVLVRRPSAERFNGTVIVEFMQEYFGTERDTNYRWNAETLLREGFAWAGASLHHEGVDLREQPEATYQGRTVRGGPALSTWDPERYGSLRIPHSDYCYDMLSQIGRALGPHRPAGADGDPLGGLPVRTVLAVGNTVAADRLRHYINAVHPLHHVFDGFYLQELTDGGITLAQGVPSPAGLRLRADCDVPVIVLNTTGGLLTAVPQTEHALLRVWEPAGSAHTSGPFMARTAEATKRDFGRDTPLGPPEASNTLPVQYVSGAALVALRRWANGGEAAPAFPRVAVTERDGERVVEVDDVGNVVGGLRTPWVDVPTARYDWRGDGMGDSGRTIPLSAGQLTRLYGSPARYRSLFAASAREAVRQGTLLPADAERAVADAGRITWAIGAG